MALGKVGDSAYVALRLSLSCAPMYCSHAVSFVSGAPRLTVVCSVPVAYTHLCISSRCTGSRSTGGDLPYIAKFSVRQHASVDPSERMSW